MKYDLLSDSWKPHFLKELFLHLLFIGLIALGGAVGLMMPFVNSNISPMWPPSGIGLAIVLCFGIRFLPSVALGSFCINSFSILGHPTLPLLPALGIMIGSTLSIWIAHEAFRRFKISTEFESVRDVVLFLIFAVLGATLFAAILGVWSLVFFKIIPGTHLGMGILTWWMGDAVGILLLTPFILSWRRFPQWNFQRWIELGSAIAVTILIAEITFQIVAESTGTKYPISFIIFPIIFWVAIRFYQQGVSLLSMLICGMGIYATINGRGLFQVGTVHESLFVLQSYIFIICGSGLFLSSVERSRENLSLAQKIASDLHQKTSQMLPGMLYQFQLFPDGKSCFPYSSQGIQQIYEVAPEEVKQDASTVIQRLHPEDLDRVMESIQTSAKSLNLWQCEYRVVLPRAGVRWLSGRSTPEQLRDGSVIWHGFISDVTERVNHEEQLIKSTEQKKVALERLHLATMSAEIGIWDCDICHQHLWWDERMYSLYGLDPSEQPSYETWTNALHPEDRLKTEDNFQMALKERKDFDAEFRILRPDGTVRFIKAHAMVQSDHSGNPIRILGVNWDQTLVKEGERHLIEGKEAAESANRSKSEFLAMMSHEIRTPMNGVIGFARLLKMTPLTSEQIDFVETIETSGQSLLSLLNDILDLSKIEAGKIVLEKHPAEIATVTQGVCHLFKFKAQEKGLEVELTVDPTLPPVVWMDPTRFKQILQNLISNAIKFTNKGKISVQVRALGLPNRSSGEMILETTVQDTGIGIDPEVIPRLFTPFMQADSSITRRYGGTGLGLVIVKRLCEIMGGSVEVRSQLGQGSTFVCTVKVEFPSGESDLIVSK